MSWTQKKRSQDSTGIDASICLPNNLDDPRGQTQIIKRKQNLVVGRGLEPRFVAYQATVISHILPDENIGSPGRT